MCVYVCVCVFSGLGGTQTKMILKQILQQHQGNDMSSGTQVVFGVFQALHSIHGVSMWKVYAACSRHSPQSTIAI